MEDIEDPLEDEFAEPVADEDDADVVVDAAEPDAAEPDTAPPAPDGAEVESLDNLIAKKDGQVADDEDPLLSLGREERLEPLAVKVIPPQPTEFVCKKCYLVKHQSQLKDKKRTLCRDCA